MIERFVFIKLTDPHANPAGRSEVRDEAYRVFPTLPGVRSFRAELPADDDAIAAWDLLLIVGFDRVEDVPAYRSAPAHVAFVDAFLGPRREVLKAWNFGGEPPSTTPLRPPR